ncbi:MAG: hypothetical protein Tsb0021_02250 [Chlamydiales bacterium]
MNNNNLNNISESNSNSRSWNCAFNGVSNSYGRTVHYLNSPSNNKLKQLAKKIALIALITIANIVYGITYPLRVLFTNRSNHASDSDLNTIDPNERIIKPNQENENTFNHASDSDLNTIDPNERIIKPNQENENTFNHASESDLNTIDPNERIIKPNQENENTSSQQFDHTFWESLILPASTTNTENMINTAIDLPLEVTLKIYSSELTNASNDHLSKLFEGKFDKLDERQKGIKNFRIALLNIIEWNQNKKYSAFNFNDVFFQFKQRFEECINPDSFSSYRNALFQAGNLLCEIGALFKNSQKLFDSMKEKGFDAEKFLETKERIENYNKRLHKTIDTQKLLNDENYYQEILNHKINLENFLRENSLNVKDLIKSCTYIKTRFSSGKQTEDKEYEKCLKDCQEAKKLGFPFESLQFYQEDPEILRDDLIFYERCVKAGFDINYLNQTNYISFKQQFNVAKALYEAFNACEPTWNEGALSAFSQLYSPTTIETAIWDDIVTMKEALVLEIGQIKYDLNQWHFLNQVRLELGTVLGLPKKTAEADCYNHLYTYLNYKEIKEHVQSKCQDTTTLINGVLNVINNKKPCSPIYRQFLAEILDRNGCTEDPEQLAFEVFFDEDTGLIKENAVKLILFDLGYLTPEIDI